MRYVSVLTDTYFWLAPLILGEILNLVNTIFGTFKLVFYLLLFSKSFLILEGDL